jgi:hypothetical protein
VIILLQLSKNKGCGKSAVPALNLVLVDRRHLRKKKTPAPGMATLTRSWL